MSDNNIAKEVWKDIPGYEGLYAASTLGRIKRYSYECTKSNQWKSYRQHVPERILVANPDSEGYCQVSLQKDGKFIQYKVHRLIMMTFSDEWDPDKEVDHIYGVKDDNRLGQLRMVTRQENNWHYWNDEAFREDRDRKFYKREFSVEYRQKLSEANRRRKGRKWVHKGTNEIRIVRPEDLQKYLDAGYEEGMGEYQGRKVRKRYSDHPVKYMSKNGKYKQVKDVDIEQHLRDGWVFGGRPTERGRHITCVSTGEEFLTIRDCAASLNIPEHTLIGRIKKNIAIDGKIYKFTEDIADEHTKS